MNLNSEFEICTLFLGLYLPSSMQFISLSSGEHLHQGSDFNLVKSQGHKISPALMKSIWSSSFASFTWISYKDSVHLRDAALKSFFCFALLISFIKLIGALIAVSKSFGDF